MEYEDVCYTRETALEKAIEMEMKSYEKFRNAYQTVKNQLAKNLIKEIAKDELDHKHNLEQAFFEETVSLHDSGLGSGPSLQLTVMLEEKPLDENATEQDVMVNAIYEKKRIVDFYLKMAGQCSGAPMAGLFQKLGKEEQDHLTKLEEIYETIYMPEN
jgi:rubrerythrin